MTGLAEWIDAHAVAIRWLWLVSLVMFVGTLAAIPLLVARIPADYFVGERRRPPSSGRERAFRVAFATLSSMTGAALVVVGVVLLVLPGQGLVTILLGVMLTSFPGKRRLERRLVAVPSVLRAMNWIRARAGRPPLQVGKR